MHAAALPPTFVLPSATAPLMQTEHPTCKGGACSRPASGFCGALQGTIAEGAPVVPISAQLKYNIDAVCEYIVKKIPVPVR